MAWRSSWRRGARWALGIVAALGLLVAAALITLPRSDWAHEEVRSRVLEALRDRVRGTVEAGRMRGHLLREVILEDLVIRDASGTAVVSAGRLRVDYSLGSLLRRHLVIEEVELVEPRILLEREPEGEWNLSGLLVLDSQDPSPSDTSSTGFGSWIRVSDAVIRDGRVTVSTPWSPPERLEDAPADSAVAAAISESSGVRVERRTGGYRLIREVRDLDARISELVLADPDEPLSGELVSLSATALPTGPAPAELRDLKGHVRVTGDSVLVEDLVLELPSSRITGQVRLSLESGSVGGTADVERLSLTDLQWLSPELPREGVVSLSLQAASSREGIRVTASQIDARLRGARVQGRGAVLLADSWRPGRSDLRFTGVDTALLERLIPSIRIPLAGTAEGRVRLSPVGYELPGDGGAASARRERRSPVADGAAADGSLPEEHVRVEGTLTFREAPRGDASVISVEGRMALPPGDRVQDLRIGLSPLRLSVLEPWTGALAVDGTLSGEVTVDGAVGGELAGRLDVEHRGQAGTTRLLGHAALGPPADAGRRISADLRAPTLSLASVGAFAPAADLRGSTRASLTATGTLSRPSFTVALSVPEGGDVRASGSLDLEGAEPQYNVRARFDGFDAHRVSGRAPAMTLNGTLVVAGRGAEPGSVDAQLRADLTDSAVGSFGPLGMQVALDASDGLVRVRRGELAARTATGRIEGAFGLVPGRTGELHVRVQVDSLSAFADLLPTDTARSGARPTSQAERVAAAGADSLRGARDTSAEATAGGRAAASGLGGGSLPALPGDSLSGSAVLEGTVSGNPERFSARGTVEVSELVAMGARVRSGRAELVGEIGSGAPPEVELAFGLESIRLAGFAFESVGGGLEHRGSPREGEGSARVEIVQDPDRDYRMQTGYSLELDAGEVRLDEMALRFDTATWVATRPGVIGWGGPGLAVDSLELRSGGEGRIFLDGRFATGAEGAGAGAEAAEAAEAAPLPGELVLEVDALPVGEIMALLQDTTAVSGLLDVDARASGPPARARIDGTLSLTEARYGETIIPEVYASWDYAPRDLALRMDVLEHRDAAGAFQDTLMTAEGTVGVDLFGGAVGGDGREGPGGAQGTDAGVSGETPGSGDGRPRPIDLRIWADSLPLESLPRFTDAVSDVRGRIRGEVVVEGTVESPRADGRVDLDLGRLDVNGAGLQLRDVAATLRLQGDQVHLDSLFAASRGGVLRMAGTADLSNAERPRLAIRMRADDAQVLDNDIGENVRIDSEVSVEGAFDSLSVSGRVQVLEGIFTVPESRDEVVDLDAPPATWALSSLDVRPEVLPEPNPLLAGLRMNVDVTVSRNTWVLTDQGTTEVYTPEGGAPLTVGYDGTAGDLVLDGVVHADRGEYEFAGRRFELTTGTATFLASREVDPLLSLTATHEVPQPGREALSIQIHVGGTLSEPAVTLTSNAEPPLSQTDLISYLVFGASSASLLQPGTSALAGGRGQELSALATQQLASLALGSLIEEAFNSVESRTRGSGLDVFRMEPAQLPDELAFQGYLTNLLRGTRFEAGKYLTRRFFVAAAGRATADAWPGLTLEYRTPVGIRVTGSWEPRYLPSLPSLEPGLEAHQARALGLFLFWERRAATRAQAPPAESSGQEEVNGATVDEGLQGHR